MRKHKCKKFKKKEIKNLGDFLIIIEIMGNLYYNIGVVSKMLDNKTTKKKRGC